MSRDNVGEQASTEPLEHSQDAIDEAKAAANRAEDVIGDRDGGWEAEPAGDPADDEPSDG